MEKEEQEQGNKNSQSSQEQNLAEDGNDLNLEEDHNNIPGSVDTFTPQERRATSMSKDQRSQPSQEQDVTEEDEDLEPEDPGRCKVHQVQRPPGEGPD